MMLRALQEHQNYELIEEGVVKLGSHLFNGFHALFLRVVKLAGRYIHTLKR